MTRGRNTEERAFRVLGLVWSGAAPSTVEQAASEVTASQLADGGWAQEADMQSDAYATGEALVALEQSGAGSARDAIRRGVEYLVRTQLVDGSWFVRSHSVPIQAYFESGYPHGADQWISAAASAWATTALAASGGDRSQVPAAARAW
jgi:squalene cyclase